MTEDSPEVVIYNGWDATVEAQVGREDDLPPPPEPWEIAWANGGEVECCASGRCEVCAPGFGGWS